MKLLTFAIALVLFAGCYSSSPYGRSDAQLSEASDVACAQPLLLDSLNSQPRFAGWTGGKLRAGYTGHIIKIRRASDDHLQDIDATATHVTDIAAVEAFCSGTTCTLVTLYDQDGNPQNIAQSDPSLQPVVYSTSALGEIGDGLTHTSGPVLGQHGFLAARFSGDINTNATTPGQRLTRADTLGIVGDVAITVAGDLSMPVSFPVDGFMVGLGKAVEDSGYTSFEVWADNTINEDPSGGSAFVRFGILGGRYFYPIPLDGYAWHAARAAGDGSAAVQFRINGSPATPSDMSDAPGNTPISIVPQAFAWGSLCDGTYTVNGVMSHVIVWQSGLDAGEATALDAWEATHRS